MAQLSLSLAHLGGGFSRRLSEIPVPFCAALSSLRSQIKKVRVSYCEKAHKAKAAYDDASQ